MEITSPASPTSRDRDNEATTANKTAAKSKSKGRKRRIPVFVKWLAVLLILGSIAAGGFVWRTQSTASAQQPTVTLAVTQGDLNVTVQSNGTIDATRQESVTYQTTGDVVEVLVKSGDSVKAGQALVRQTDADQKAAVNQAQAALNTAHAKLDDLKKGPTASEVASAKADVASAQAALNSVKAGASKKDIADAQATLKSAQASLAAIKGGATQKEITDAEADLEMAKAKYEALMAPASSSDVKEAQSKLDVAKAKLAAVKSKPTAAQLSAAQLAVANAEASLKSIQNKAALDKQTKQLALDKADRDLGQAQTDWANVLNKKDSKGNPIVDDQNNFIVDRDDRNYDSLYNTYWTAYNALKNAQAAQTQAYDNLQNVLHQEVVDVASAQAKIDDAKTQLATVQAGATADELASAQADVNSAQKALDTLMSGASTDDVASAQAAMTKAQTALDQLRAGPTADDLTTAQTAVDKAQNTLNDLLSGSTADKIAAAQATLAQKQASLQALYDGTTASDIATAEEAEVTAQKNLDDANADVTKTILTAPFSGVVASVSAEPNAKVTVGGEALSIYDETGMHVQLKVNESDIAKLKEGQLSSITIDALPGKVLTGTVSTVSNVATTNQDVVTYQVDVQFDPARQAIKTGMSANATIVVESHKNVIEVPTRAIKTQGRNKTVQVLYGQDQTPVTINVTTGASNSQVTEITGCVETGSQCLQAGDRLAVAISTSTTTGNNQQFPGGFPGGGAIPAGGGQFGGGQFRGNGGTGTRP